LLCKEFGVNWIWLRVRFGFMFLMNRISKIKQSNFLRHFFKTVNWSCRLVVFFQVFTNSRMFMFGDGLKEMSWSISNIICITQITQKFVNNAMLVDQGRFGLHHLVFFSTFPLFYYNLVRFKNKKKLHNT